MKKIRIKYTALAPISHIGESASTGSYFQTVLTSNGRVPVLTGNSIRGQLRDCMAKHLLDRIGVKVNKDVFNILFSGGNVNESMRDDVEKAKQIREHFPMISLLGGGLGDMIMAGKMVSGFAFPVCSELESVTGIESDISWHSLIDEIEFTRTDDGKNDVVAKYLIDSSEEKTAKASTQMRFSVQYLAAGSELVQDIRFLDSITRLELGAFYAGLVEWFKVPTIGGMAAKGFGLFDAIVYSQDGNEDIVLMGGSTKVSDDVDDYILDYETFLDEERDIFFPLLSAKKERGNGKKTNDSD